MPRVHSIVAAGGEGNRYGGETPKQLIEIHGRTVLDWSIAALLGATAGVTVAVPESLLGDCPSEFAGEALVSWVAGGASRWRSVAAAFAELAAAPDDLVAVHDAARPALDAGDLAAVIDAARLSGAAVLGRRVSDTIKRLADGRIVATVDRSRLFRAETPQVFRHDLLQRGLAATAAGNSEPTDEAAMIESLADVEPTAVEARLPNPKLTEPADLELVSTLLHGRAA